MTYPVRVRATALIIQHEAVLLIEFDDENGLHYNLPGGGVEAGESIIQAVKREAREEAAVEVEVGPLAFVYEYQPQLNGFTYGPVHTLNMIFDCKLSGQARPRMPARPDPNQTGVKWVALADLVEVNLLPRIMPQIIQYAEKPPGDTIFIEESCFRPDNEYHYRH